MKVLITGADGLLGNNLIRELLEQKYEVKVLLYPGKLAKSLMDLNIEVHYADITKDLGLIDKAISGCEAVFHCAAITDVLAPDLITYQVNVEGTENIIKACIRNKVKRMIFVGSASSFQFGTCNEPGNEKNNFASVYKGIAYMESKHKAMELVKYYVNKGSLDAVIVAPTFMLGAYDTRPSSGEIIKQHLQRDLNLAPAGGRNFVYVKDVANGMILALEKGKSGQCYILGNQNLSYKDFFSKVNKIVGRPKIQRTIPRFVFTFVGLVASLAQRLFRMKTKFNYKLSQIITVNAFYSSRKAVEELGMSQTSIDKAIEESISSLKTYGYL